MKLFVDARTVRPGRTGVGYYTESMVRALAQVLEDRGSVTALSLFPDELEPVPPGLIVRKTRADYESHPLGELYENLILPRMIRREGFDLFWGPAFLIPWVPVGVPRVVTIHDLTAFSHPECYRTRFAYYMRMVIRQAVRRADALVCVSDSVARQVEAAFRPRVPVVAAGAAADPFFCPGPSGRTREGHGRYLLAIGAGDPRKDTRFLLRLYRHLRRLAGERVPELYLVGEWPREELGDGVRLLPRQSREALRDLYRGAVLFLYPTASEGFGLPILEAMRCGCPVAASRAGAVPEVAGEAAFLFDHRSAEDTAAALLALINDSSRLEELSRAGLQRADSFSWEKSAKELLDLFTGLVERGRL